MWRIIIISILVIYLVNKLGGLLFRFMGQSQAPPQFKRPGDNSINMDTPPKKPNRKTGLKGGEYVDFEEIK